MFVVRRSVQARVLWFYLSDAVKEEEMQRGTESGVKRLNCLCTNVKESVDEKKCDQGNEPDKGGWAEKGRGVIKRTPSRLQ